MGGRLRTRVGLGLLSIAGTTAGHYLSYWLAAPDSHHRDELLEATGHAGESPFVILSVAALLATCVAILGGSTRKHPSRLPSTFIRLAALQLVAFVVLETTERAIEGTSLLEAAREPVVWLGLLVQIAVAAAGAGLLRLLQRAAAFVATAPPRVTPYEIGVALDGATALFSRNTGRHWEARGPPRSS